MANDELRAIDDPSPEDLAFVEDAINRHNMDATGHHDGRYLAIFVRDGGGRIRAGLTGHTWGGTAEVRFLWVREGDRHAGLGTALLREAEREAKARGCGQVVLTTHAFQAPRFYARHGYHPCGEFSDYPRGSSQIFLRKSLV